MSTAPHPTHPGWWIIRYYPQGKAGGLKTETVRGGTMAQARAIEMQLRREARGVSHAVDASPTIAQAIPYFLDDYRLDHLPGGVAVMARYLARWSGELGNLRFPMITPRLIDEYKRRRLGSGVKPTTINKELSALSSIARWAKERGYSSSLPDIKRFPRKLTKAPLPDVPTREELLAVINCMRWPACGLFACLYFAGLRASEASGLRAEQVHVEAGMMIVRGKGNKERVVPIVDELRPVLIRRLTEISTGLMWPTRNGRRITDLKKYIATAKVAAGLTRHIHPHLLRHAFGTHATMSGVGLRSLQYAMGHSSPVTTEVYTTLSSQAIIDDVKKFGKRKS